MLTEERGSDLPSMCNIHCVIDPKRLVTVWLQTFLSQFGGILCVCVCVTDSRRFFFFLAQRFRTSRALKVNPCNTVVPAGAVPGQMFPSLHILCHLRTLRTRLPSPGSRQRRDLGACTLIPRCSQTIPRKGQVICETKSEFNSPHVCGTLKFNGAKPKSFIEC